MAGSATIFDNRRLPCCWAVFALYPALIAACVALRSIRYSGANCFWFSLSAGMYEPSGRIR